MFEHLGTALLLGLSAAVPIGPVNVEIMRRGLRGGFAPALSVGLGAATVDGAYSIAFTLGFTALPDPGFQRWLATVGASVLIALGVQTILSAWREGAAAPTQGSAQDTPSKVQGPSLSAYLVGLAMTATNPMTLVFWVSVGATLSKFPLQGFAGKLLLAGGVIAGALLWVFSFATALHVMRHKISERTKRMLTTAGGLGIVLFGLRLFSLR